MFNRMVFTLQCLVVLFADMPFMKPEDIPPMQLCMGLTVNGVKECHCDDSDHGTAHECLSIYGSFLFTGTVCFFG